MKTSDILARMTRGTIGRQEMAQLIELVWAGSGFSRWSLGSPDFD
ncbi:MAG: hypothetical protein ACYDHF_00390 [Candidatus Cryosericum sp.]|jgi:hypothetical protein